MPSSLPANAPSPSLSRTKEVILVLQTLLRILRARLDADRIDAHRDAVHRRISLTIPPR